jgi:dual specificity phosphatase 12
MIENDVNEIIPNLWLGNLRAAYNKDFLIRNNIKYIITIMDNFDCQFKYDDITHLVIPFKDPLLCFKNLIHLFDMSTDFIKNGLLDKKAVLVHCKNGHNRSASIVAGFLIKYIKIDYVTAIHYINHLRPGALKRDTCMTRGLFKYYLHLNNIKNCNTHCTNKNGYFNCYCQKL